MPTPMMEQYYRIKSENSDSILLFRLGDFYEMFENDAIYVSRVLSIALTKRNGIPMCGFPYHAADTYIARLLREGNKIALCEQTEDPSQAKGIVRREVVEIISPGIITDPELLSSDSANCIAALTGLERRGEVTLACACLDVSTGEFNTTVIGNGDAVDLLLDEIDGSGIREVIHPESMTTGERLGRILETVKRLRTDVVFREQEEYLFNRSRAEEVLRSHFSVQNVDVFELRHDLEVTACGTLLSYVKDNVRQELSHIQWVRGKRREGALFIDNATKKHLELTQNQMDGSVSGTLLAILDRTETPMGGRALRKSLNNPFGELGFIRRRQDQVAFLNEHGGVRQSIGKALSRILDIERVLSRLALAKGNARDLIGLRSSLCAAGEIGAMLEESENEAFIEEVRDIADFTRIIETIERAVEDDPPMSVHEGRLIREGYHEKLDELRRAGRENREWINRYQHGEQETLGISSLKVRFNKIIGYYIEVTKPNLHLVPAHYIRKQTLVNADRFTTEELERHETLLMEARDHSNQLEFQIFEDIRMNLLKSTDELYRAAEAVARVDVCCSLASVARDRGYCKPEIVEENIIDIRDGRHPVVEVMGEESFISNDLHLNEYDRRIMILTGPNMAGKSTYLRQCALIVILAHMGSFVPAAEARIGLVDRVFSRIGASDRLVKGESTFLVEMIETSRILHYATDRSFIIMDEIGRGTSTYDGLSIAWAVLEYLLGEMAGAKVLFATHYHEITALRDRFGVVNCNVTVKEWNNRVVFLRKIVPGSASKSYGIEVARMAGIPDRVIDRAKEVLDNLENTYGGAMPLLLGEEEGAEHRKTGGHLEREAPDEEEQPLRDRELQFELFPSPLELLIKELKMLDIEHITPLDALNILDRLKRSLSR
jgi:DNA mismatch repair protein MutS